MRLFVLVVRLGSFSAAGRQMGLSPASVSRHINSLEDSLGTTLVNRSSRRLSLTEAGEILFQRATAILRDVDDTHSQIAEIGKGPRGTLHVHARVLVGKHLVLPVLSAFAERYPEVNLIVTLSDEPVDLVQQNIDLSVRGARAEGLSLIIRKLGSSGRALCASPAYVAQHGAPQAPDDLTRHRCLTYQFDLSPPSWNFRPIQATGSENIRAVSPAGHVQVNDGEALRRFALDGLGIALMPEWSVMADINSGGLVRVLPEFEFAPADSGFGYSIFALYQRTRHESPKLRAFLDLLAQSIRNRERAGWV